MYGCVFTDHFFYVLVCEDTDRGESNITDLNPSLIPPLVGDLCPLTDHLLFRSVRTQTTEKISFISVVKKTNYFLKPQTQKPHQKVPRQSYFALNFEISYPNFLAYH
jgi:hypothetical protein